MAKRLSRHCYTVAAAVVANTAEDIDRYEMVGSSSPPNANNCHGIATLCYPGDRKSVV